MNVRSAPARSRSPIPDPGAVLERAGEVRIREGESSDRPYVRDLTSRTIAGSVSTLRPGNENSVKQSAKRMLDYAFDQPHCLLIAQDGSNPAGFALMLEGLPDEVTLEPQGFILYLAVEPLLRRQGIGRRLLARAESAAREKGLPHLALMVTEENAAARALYEGGGFQSERRLLVKPL